MTNFAKQKIEVSDQTKRFVFLKNGIYTFEYTRSNRNKQRMQKFMVSCVECVRSLLEAARSICLKNTGSFVLRNSTVALLNNPTNSNIFGKRRIWQNSEFQEKLKKKWSLFLIARHANLTKISSPFQVLLKTALKQPFSYPTRTPTIVAVL